MQRQSRLILILSIVTGLLLAGPSARAEDSPIDVSKLPPVASRAIDFAADVRPILEASCAKCHNARKAKGGLQLHSREAALLGGDSGVVVVPGDSEKSLLIHAVSGLGEVSMPPGGQKKRLSVAQIGVLRAWIDQGLAWSNSDTPSGGASAPRSGDALHWSFRPIRAPEPPEVRNKGWVRNEIDRFVLAKLEARGIGPSPTADRATLIRRLSLDLLGLLPSPAQVKAFVSDERPDAYQQLVRQILDSPHFGERWGRHWLDLARYADSDGYEKDRPRPWAWRYRDWVIRAINQDLPFDQFTREQLAGDLLPGAGVEQRVATGFHRNTLTNTEGGTDQEEFRVKAIVDRVNTTGSVWLGLTVGCSQCHTHKYDPLTQREYYGLFAFFNNADERNVSAPLPDEAESFERALAQHAAEERKLAAAVASYESSRQSELTTWLSTLEPVRWAPLEIDEARARSGATLDSRSPGEIVAHGTKADTDTYTLDATAKPGVISALRLEVLPDAALPSRGPGRAPNGNFVLSEIEIGVAVGKGSEAPRRLKVATATADHSQPEFAVSRAIDGDRKNHGWAIGVRDGGLNQRRVAIFRLADPVRLKDDESLILTLHQNHGGEHTIGRFRVSVTNATARALAPESAVLESISRSAAERSEAETGRLRALFFAKDARWRELSDRVAGHAKAKPSRSSTQAQVLVERTGGRRNTHLLVRGDFLRKGPEVLAGAPGVLHAFRGNVERATRLDLADWILDDDNPLTARVTVNRWWRHLFARGIVPSVDDFGTRGDRPTHPQLLDWLASELRRRGWSRKAMVELIVSSATYRQSSAFRTELSQSDPQNELLARQNRFRVEAEIVRDLSLDASGLLHEQIGGPSVRPPLPAGVADLGYANSVKWPESKGRDRHRRGMYIFFQRTVPYPMLMSFDSPDSNVSCLERTRSNTPLQALTLLNDRVFFECAQALGVRALEDSSIRGNDDRLRRAFRWCLSRAPTVEELERLRSLLEQARKICAEDPEGARGIVGNHAVEGVPGAELAAWVTVSRVLLNLDEFISRE